MLSDLSANGGFKTDIKETPEEYVLHAELQELKRKISILTMITTI